MSKIPRQHNQLPTSQMNIVNFEKIRSATFTSAIGCHEATDHADLVSRLRLGFKGVGFEYYSVTEATAGRGHDGLRPLVGVVNEPWQMVYRESRLHLSDLRIRRARISARPFFCSEVLREDSQVTAAEREFWAKAASFGIFEGYVLPHRTAGGRVFAAVLIGEGRPINPVIRVATQMLSFEFICAALRLSTEKADADSGAPRAMLSRRQIQCLELLAAGKNSAAIAHELGISHRTVDHYVGDACAKLRVRSRAQAVATAIGLQLIDQPQTGPASGQ